MEFQVYRTKNSVSLNIQAENFLFREREKLEKNDKLNYLTSLDECRDDLPLILLTNTHTKITALPKKIWKSVKLLIHTNSGYDNFPPSFVAEANFPIVVGNPIRALPVTEYVISALMHHYCPIKNQSLWDRGIFSERELLNEKRVLVFGYGEIGSKLVPILKPLVKSITVFDPYKNFLNNWRNNFDIVILAASLNQENYSIIDKSFLQRLKDDFLLINIARGELIKEDDLINALIDRPKATAILDVFSTEPNNFAEKKYPENMIKTSHIAGAFNKLDQTIIQFSAKVIDSFLMFASDEFEKEYSDLLLR